MHSLKDRVEKDKDVIINLKLFIFWNTLHTIPFILLQVAENSEYILFPDR